MANLLSKDHKFESLRKQAERLVSRSKAPQAFDADGFLDLMHELQVHQIELEIQNEELKQAQGRILTLQHQFEELYEGAPCGYITLNAKGLIERCNRVGLTLLGGSAVHSIQRGFSSFVSSKSQGVYLDNLRKSGRDKTVQKVKLLLRRDDDSEVWVEADIQAVCDAGGQVLEWRLLLVDITDRIELETQLAHAQKMESLGVLAGGIAHEFNNILTIISGNASLVSDRLDKNSLEYDCLKDVVSAGERARDIVQQLLSFGRKKKLSRRAVELVSMVKLTVQMIRALIPANIEIRQRVLEAPLVCCADETQLQQLLINLCNNAADELLVEGGVIDMELSSQKYDQSTNFNGRMIRPGEYVQLTVSDNGKGIDPKFINQIFDPFFTTKDIGKGTGLGLSVVNGIVESHAGYVGVDSVPGEGTTFTILLPQYTGPLLNESLLYLEDVLQGNERLMVVDDEASIGRYLQRVLTSMGYSVEVFTHPIEALTAFRQDPYSWDLVITDMAMPEMTGEKLTFFLLESRPDLPVILSTGHSERVTEALMARLGVSGTIFKPFDRVKLVSLIREVLNHQGERHT